MAAGQWVLSWVSWLWLAAKDMVNRPSGPIRIESQRWQFSPIYVDYHPRQALLEFLQLSDVVG